ncbi:hypothetical protein WG66_016054, partial [Moniliophthora roreri]
MLKMQHPTGLRHSATNYLSQIHDLRPYPHRKSNQSPCTHRTRNQ